MPFSWSDLRRRWVPHLPAVLFLGAASYLLLRSHVYAAPKVVKVSELAMYDLNGAAVPPQATAGKAVVLNFWAPWCGPCRIELPWLQHLQQTHPEVAVVGLEDDAEEYEQARTLAEKSGVTYLLVRSDGAMRAKFGQVAALPTTLYISPSGRVVHTVTGIVPEVVMRHYLQDATSSP